MKDGGAGSKGCRCYRQAPGSPELMYKPRDGVPGIKFVRDEKKEWLPVRVIRKGKEFSVC